MRKFTLLLLFTIAMRFAGYGQGAKQLIDSALHYKTLNYLKVIAFAEPAFKKARAEKNEKLAGQSAYLLGMANYLGGNFDESLRWYFTSERAYQSAKDTSGLTDLYADMCVFYVKLKKFNAADEVSKKAIDFAIAIKNQTKQATALNNRGLMFYDEGKTDSAIDAFNASFILYKKVNDKVGMSYCLDYLSSAQSDKGNYSKALQLMNSARDLRAGIGDKTGEAMAIENLGEIYLKENKLPDAATYFLDAIDRAHQLNFLDLEMYAYSMLSKTYQQQGNYRAALTAQNKYVELNKKIQDEKRVKTIEELETKYETEKKQEQIKLLNKQNTIQQLEIGKRNATITIIIAAFALALVLAYLFYSRYRIKHAAQLQAEVMRQQTLASKGIIEAEERERKRIAAELHDGVGQLFTAVKMNMEILVERFLVKKPDAGLLAEKTMAMVDESCAEVRSIAHQMMPNALIKSGLVSALRDFINKIPTEKLKISLETKGIDTPLDSTTETVLYRVIQESVNNVIKHAAASSLDILLLCDQQEITVSIEDNGKGFNSSDPAKFSGIGLKNIISRVGYLKGTVDISSAPGKGTLVAIFIPLI
ncbi:tetratricopeptide repeat-containing sensor histidine kinase [Mucilaginibacter gotjawali]|uniref:Signal transduction histidine kinase n=2 Tax=Mucilaginibacter gotjawali TaxID=1550579 RepID=A0A839SJS8_9SPHI|nr:sensor histidine kinase [Mucilaginibacter gotjawali]MBB3058591.1 signal transduction histidine kinase [Mucilaginibacter gotjawali]BAU52442.1 Signal transduction histidine-protein kinase/phosphatase DegS [Mucilaginibacter gotjawali]